MKKVLSLVFILLVSITLTGCGASASASEKQVVRIGVAGAFQQQWDAVVENLEGTGIEIELVHFSDWSLLNPALIDGEIELNAFQNVFFLDNAISTNGFEITSLGYTFITPLSIFAGGQADIPADPTRSSLVGLLQDGDRVGIPGDATNAGRALKLLEAAGLIDLDPAVGFMGSENDIINFNVNIEIISAEANTLPQLLPDLAAAVINGGPALTNNLSPTQDSIFREDAFNLEITDALRNVIASRSEDANNPIFAKIVQAYQQQNVIDVFNNEFGGAFIPAW